MPDPKILHPIRHNGVLYKTGDEKALNDAISPKTAQRLSKARFDETDDESDMLLEGTFTGNKDVKDEVRKPRILASRDAGQAARPRGVKRSYGEDADENEPEVDREVVPPGGQGGGAGTPIPTGFPGRAALIKAKYDTLEKVRAASDEDLEKVDGIGEGTVAKIREQK